jgi:protein-disulfide isomerase
MEKRKNSEGNNTFLLLGVIIAAAVVAVAAIVISSQGGAVSDANIDYSQVSQSRTADGGFVLGNPDAEVTLMVFEDFLCPHCQRYTRDTLHPFIKQFVLTGQAKFEFRILLTQQLSQPAAQFAECAEILSPGSFWKAHDVMFAIASASRFTQDGLREFAEQMGMSYSELLTCSAEADQYTVDGNLARQYGVKGTPTVFIKVGDGEPRMLQGQPSLAELTALIGLQMR